MKSGKLKILISVTQLWIIYSLNVQAQYISVDGKRFVQNGNTFYPIVLNYGINLVNYCPNLYFAAPNHSYNLTNDFECGNIIQCSNKIQEDFNYISGMGFNTIRIVGADVSYKIGEGIKAFGKIHQDCNMSDYSLPIDPSNINDFAFQQIIGVYRKILELANSALPNPLKVIFLTTGTNDPPIEFDYTGIDLISLYLTNLAQDLSNAPYKEALLAFDLFNEPCGHIDPLLSKAAVCNMIELWYNSIKIVDPNYLITIGSCGISDVFSFDPALLKVDFNSLHYYPSFKPFEDRNHLSTQENARIRSANDLYWMNHASIKPWIIGETGFTAIDNNSFNSETTTINGKLSDMGDYANFSLHSSYNCGASGYSWWTYQDVWWGSGGNDHYGLLKRGFAPSSVAEKQPAVNIFRNYIPSTIASCPVDYSPVFNSTSRYYNPFLYPPNPTMELSALVVDQSGQPVKDAVVGISVLMGTKTNVPFPISEYDFYHTFTDQNGYFRIIPYRYLSDLVPNSDFKIVEVKLSAPGFDFIKWNMDDGDLVPPLIELNKSADHDYEVNLESVFALEQKHFQGRKTLNVSNTSVWTDGTATFTSANEIHVSDFFRAQTGSNVHFYISDIPAACSEYISPSLNSRQTSKANSINKSTDLKQETIELVFQKTAEIRMISLHPNPANETLWVKLQSDNPDASFQSFKLFNLAGMVVLSQNVSGSSFSIDLSTLSKGMYFIETDDSVNKYKNRFIKQ
jgi:hypothetical protein